MPEFPFFSFIQLVSRVYKFIGSECRPSVQANVPKTFFGNILLYGLYNTCNFFVVIKKINILRRVKATDLVLSKKYVDQYRITFSTVIGLMDICQKSLSSVRSQWFSFILFRYTLVVISYLKQYSLTMNRNSKIGTGMNSEFFPRGR